VRKRDFEAYYARYRDTITAIARKLAGTDDDLVADLEQEGVIALWKLNPARATKNRDAWIRQAIKFRMVDYLRKNDPRMYESLDTRLACGDQLEQDEVGDLILRTSRHPSRAIEETDYESLDENVE